MTTPSATAPSARFERIAHRGASREFRENTMPAFVRALERGADAVELDVHCTADGIVVVHHDPDVQGHAISESPWSRLQELDLGAGERMPTLREIFAAVDDRAVLYVELKRAGIEAAVVGMLRTYSGRSALHSFDHGMIERAARLAPDIPRGVLLDRNVADPLALLDQAVKRTGARDIWPHSTLVDDAMMAAARRHQARVITWTVNSMASARALVALGVDGICTDDLRLIANL